MPLSGAQRTQRYREKLKQNRPEEYERQRKTNLAKVKSKKKKVSELNPEEAEIRREKWRKEKRNSRQRQKKVEEQHRSRDVNPIPGTSSATQENKSEYNLANENCIRKLRRRNKVLFNKCKLYSRYIDKLKKNTQTYRKQLQRLEIKKDKEIKDLNSKIVKMQAREEILESTLKQTYQSCSNRKEKQTLKNLAINSSNKTMISKMLGLKGKIRKNKTKLRRNEISEITKFYTRDDITRNTAGKKEVRTKSKEKVQIRYLLDTLVNTFRKYKAENGRYGFTTFYKHKPFYVLSPGLSSRSTCLCIKHSNFGFIHAAMIKNNLVTGSIKDILCQVSCDTNNYECMWNKCEECKHKKVQYNQSSDEKLMRHVEWSRWERQDHTYQKKDGETTKEINTKKTAKVTRKGTLSELKEDFEKDLILFKKHYFNMKHQQNQYQKAVLGLKENEALIVCDFSENYQAKLAEEIQSMHYGASNLQICLHTGMVFWKNRCQSFCTLSDNTSHQPPAIWAHLIPILDMAMRESPETTVIHFYTDGPSAQYRQKNNFYLLVHYTKEYQLQYSTWSYYEAGHGKNVADGIGGSIKRTLDKKVCTGNDIVDANDAYNLLKQSLQVTKVFLIESAEIENVAKILPVKIPMLKGTMQLHQVMTSQNGESNKIHYRDIGCFCGDQRGQCDCFSPKSHFVMSSSPYLPKIQRKTSKKSMASTKENLTKNPDVMETNPSCLSSLSMTIDISLKPSTEMEDRAVVEGSLDELHRFQPITEYSAVKTSLECTQSPEFSKNVNNNIDNFCVEIEDMQSLDELCGFQSTTQYPTIKTSLECTHTPEFSKNVNNNIENFCVEIENTQSFDILEENEITSQELTQAADESQSHYIDPNKVIIMRRDKSQPANQLTPTKDLPKQSSIIIIKGVKPLASTSKDILPKKRSTIQYPGKKICKKPKIEQSEKMKFGALICQNCFSSIFGNKEKCIICKNWFCGECVRGHVSSTYVCETCLNK